MSNSDEIGHLIDYQIRLYGLPVRWRSQIQVFDPPTTFTYIQLSGPYRRLRHSLEFINVAGGGTEVRDTVDYELPFWPTGDLPLGARARFAKASFRLQAFSNGRDYGVTYREAGYPPPGNLSIR